MSYSIPEPTTHPIQALVMFYKITKGVEFDDRVWDKIHFARCMKAAREILCITNSYEIAKKCLEELSENFNSKQLSWTLETISKHTHDWNYQRGNTNAINNERRKRFFDALARQRAEGANQIEGKFVTAGEMLNTIGNLTVLQPEKRGQEGSGNQGDGGIGESIQQTDVEKKTA